MAEGSSGTDRHGWGAVYPAAAALSSLSLVSVGLPLSHDYYCGGCEVFRFVVFIMTLVEIVVNDLCVRVLEL